MTLLLAHLSSAIVVNSVADCSVNLSGQETVSKHTDYSIGEQEVVYKRFRKVHVETLPSIVVGKPLMLTDHCCKH